MSSDRPAFSAVRRRRLVDEVIRQLQERISLNKLDPGTKLPPEPELMTQFGVGRSTLREAVRVLVHAGLLEVRQGNGTYVRARIASSEPLEQRLQRAEIQEVYEVRRILEIEIARLAAERRDEADLDRMRASLDKRRAALQAGNNADFLDADISFHVAIATASKNAVAADLYLTFSSALREALMKLITDPVLGEYHASIHEQLFEAIAHGDAAAAERRTREYLGSTMQKLGNLLGEQ